MDHRRVIDLAFTLPAVPVAAALTAALAGLVKLTSPGPAFFVQRRVGKGGSPVHVVKLRTMIDGAERLGPAVTAARDPRITTVGRLLRRTKLDELPQLFNVLRGDMSLVGPRPEAERYVALYRPEWKDVLDVRPGITDPASLAFRDEESLLALASDRERAYVEVLLPAKLELAVEGVRRRSVLRDVGTIVDTLLHVTGVRRGEHAAVQRCRDAILAMNRESA
jgi:lipopolysaccharide/colanic/teichoic acid biosynthesis glycosyltransferase